jgi:hypothetical protein
MVTSLEPEGRREARERFQTARGRLFSAVGVNRFAAVTFPFAAGGFSSGAVRH